MSENGGRRRRLRGDRCEGVFLELQGWWEVQKWRKKKKTRGECEGIEAEKCHGGVCVVLWGEIFSIQNWGFLILEP